MNKRRIYSFLREGIKAGITAKGSYMLLNKASLIIFNTTEATTIISTAGTCMKIVNIKLIGEPNTAVMLRHTPSSHIFEKFLYLIRDNGVEIAIESITPYMSKERMKDVEPIIPMCNLSETINCSPIEYDIGFIYFNGQEIDLIKCGNFKYAKYMIQRSLNIGKPIYQTEDGLLYFKKVYPDYTLTSIDFSIKE